MALSSISQLQAKTLYRVRSLTSVHLSNHHCCGALHLFSSYHPLSWYRAHGRPSKEEKAKRQQYLTPSEEKALVEYLLRMSNNGFPVPVKCLPSLALIIARQPSSVFQAPASDETIKPPGKKWPQAFYKRYPELQPKRVKALDWNRHDNNIHDKITHWFEVIGKQLQDPVIVP
jgi:hypothetical protein